MLCTLIVAIILSTNIHVGLNMNLGDDIGDASSSLRGSTSSFYLINVYFSHIFYYDKNSVKIAFQMLTAKN